MNGKAEEGPKNEARADATFSGFTPPSARESSSSSEEEEKIEYASFWLIDIAY